MQKIKVDVENLQFAVTHFLQASNELKELEYRLKQLGNEFCDDPDLLIVPEYEMIMTHYTELSNNIFKLCSIFEGLTGVVSKIPELYAEAERSCIERTESLLLKSDKYQKSFTDETTHAKISSSNSVGIKEEELAEMIKRNFTDLLFSEIEMQKNEQLTGEKENA